MSLKITINTVLLVFWSLFVLRFPTTTFQKLDQFPSLDVQRKVPTQLGTSERAILNHQSVLSRIYFLLMPSIIISRQEQKFSSLWKQRPTIPCALWTPQLPKQLCIEVYRKSTHTESHLNSFTAKCHHEVTCYKLQGYLGVMQLYKNTQMFLSDDIQITTGLDNMKACSFY